MRQIEDNANSLIELIERKAPEYFDLLTAENDKDFETAFDSILESAVSKLEENKKNFKTLDEEGLSAALAMAIGIPGLRVIQEGNSNGHVDISIAVEHNKPIRKKLIEAKIYDGPEYHIKGLEQLITRYTTGREGRGIIVVYVRKKNIAVLFEKLREAMDEKLPCNQQGTTTDHHCRWSFLSIHRLESGDDHEVGHFGCNLFIE